MDERTKKCIFMYGMILLAIPENFMKIGWKKCPLCLVRSSSYLKARCAGFVNTSAPKVYKHPLNLSVQIPSSILSPFYIYTYGMVLLVLWENVWRLVEKSVHSRLPRFVGVCVLGRGPPPPFQFNESL